MPKFMRKGFGFNNNDWEQTSDEQGRTRMVPRFDVNPIEKRSGMLLTGINKHTALSLPEMTEYLQSKDPSYTYNDVKQPLVWLLGGKFIRSVESKGVVRYKLTSLGKALVGKKRPLSGG